LGAALTLVTNAGANDVATPARAMGDGRQTEQVDEGTVVVRFARAGVETRVAPTQTLLEAAEAQGVEIPSLCRAGSCQTCRTRVIAGDVCCDSDSLSEEERAEGFVLPCVSHARGDCELEA
jgi:ferredoxin